jgi:hypothetical protein
LIVVLVWPGSWHGSAAHTLSLLNGIVLDLDGILVDTNHLHVEAFARALLEVDRPIPRCVLHAVSACVRAVTPAQLRVLRSSGCEFCLAGIHGTI